MLKDTRYVLNPSGAFIIGGPTGDAGLTGRKLLQIPMAVGEVMVEGLFLAKIPLKLIDLQDMLSGG